jgi:hypothetical protein
MPIPQAQHVEDKDLTSVAPTHILVDFVKHIEHMYKVFSLTLCADKCLLQVGS